MTSIDEQIKFENSLIQVAENLISSAKKRIRDLEAEKKRLVDVTFLGDKFNRTYTYVDDSGELRYGDLVKAGYKEGIAQVVRSRPATTGALVIHKSLPRDCRVQLPLSEPDGR